MYRTAASTAPRQPPPPCSAPHPCAAGGCCRPGRQCKHACALAHQRCVQLAAGLTPPRLPPLALPQENVKRVQLADEVGPWAGGRCLPASMCSHARWPHAALFRIRMLLCAGCWRLRMSACLECAVMAYSLTAPPSPGPPVPAVPERRGAGGVLRLLPARGVQGALISPAGPSAQRMSAGASCVV